MFFIMSNIPELLYHIILTVIDYHVDPSGAQRSIHILGTRSTLEAAKHSSYRVLQALRYKPQDFVQFAVHSSHTGTWAHGNGVLVYARAPAGQVFLVSVQATPNTEDLVMDHEGGVILPRGASSLHYIVQTTIDYNKDRTGCEQEMQIEGTFVHRSRALAAAQKLLDPLDYVDYETPEKMADEWPFAEEVVAHAVAETGQNITIAVTTASDSHLRHEK
jgi:Fe-S cluster assembly iron-binding protein IscA